jgi:hypothetical protein
MISKYRISLPILTHFKRYISKYVGILERTIQNAVSTT